jgi:hypothetical protein
MFLKSALAVAATITLLPLSVYAGGSPPPAGGAAEVAPKFDSEGTSGVVVQSSGGYIVGFNMSGTDVTGSGPLNRAGGYQAQTGGTLGWPDLDGNGVTDLVVVAPNGRFQYAYLYEDGGAFVSVVSAGSIPALPAGSSLLGWPDLNGDGKSDMVIQNDSTGATTGFLMDGLEPTEMGSVPGLPGYETIGFPDLDGDGNADIVLQSASGFTYAYLMNGLDVSSAAPIPSAPSSQNYSTSGFPDLNGDGAADVVIQHSGGYAYGYLMAGTSVSDEGSVGGLRNYAIIGFPDLDGDGNDDIVQQAASGFSAGRLMDGVTAGAPAQVPGLSTSRGYTTIGFPNLDAADGTDIVVQHSGGYTFAYLMNGLGAASSQASIPGAPPGYTTIGW